MILLFKSHFEVIPLQSLISVSLYHSVLCVDVLTQNKESTESVNNISDFTIVINILMCRDFSTQPLLSSSPVYEYTSQTHLGVASFVIYLFGF